MKHFLIFLLLNIAAAAQTHEVGLTLGRLGGSGRSSGDAPINLDSGIALQANYGYRFALTGRVAWTGEVHFLANGQREIRSANAAVTRDVATLFVTPGLRVKYLASKRFAPYATIGAGYALYEQSFFRIDGASNQASRFTHRGALQYGGGIDVPVWHWLAVRFEVRDFYTGNPSFNVPVSGGGQHNVVAGGGFVLNFGRNE